MSSHLGTSIRGMGWLALLGSLALLGGRAAAEEGDAGPWPADVPGYKAPASGEHPRLFFRRGNLASLRERARTPEGKAILERLKTLLGGGKSMPEVKSEITTAYGKEGGPKPPKEEEPVGAYSMSHAAGFGLLYQLTGEKAYADLGKECFEWAFKGVRDRDREGRYSFKQPGGALRAGPSLGWYAVGYDLCYDGWDEAFRTKVAGAIANYNEGQFMSLEELVRGARHMPGSNHWGMQVGGGALALLAITGDPGVDQGKIDKLLAESQKSMIRNLTEGFGDHGWFAEGDGTGSMSSHIVFASALRAWKVAGGKDFISPRPNAPWMTLKWIFLTIVRNGKPDFPGRGGYPQNIWDRGGLSGGGYFAQGFGAVAEPQRAALLWFYDHNLKDADARNGTPFDTASVYPHNTVMAFINWPFGTQEVNPAEVIPRAVRDEKYGFYMCRNRWQDANDIIVSVQTRSTRGFIRANSNGDVVVWGLGKKRNWGRVRGDIAAWQPAADGSAILTAKDGTCLAIDFSKASGADGMLVMTGPGAPQGDAVPAGGTAFRFLFLTAGDPPTPRAEASAKPEGDKVVVGGQTVSMRGSSIVLGKMAAP